MRFLHGFVVLGLLVGCKKAEPPELGLTCPPITSLEGTSFADLALPGLLTGKEWRVCANPDSLDRFLKNTDPQQAVAQSVAYLKEQRFVEGSLAPKVVGATITPASVLVRDGVQLAIYLKPYPNNRDKPIELSYSLFRATAPKPPATVAPVSPTSVMVEPMKKLAFMRGVWRGPASGIGPDGQKYEVTQTERMGPLLGGDVIVIEGRGYKADGSTGFNALGIVSWNKYTKKYEFRSYAQGNAGTFDFALTDTGYVWSTPAGPDRIMRFTATVKDNKWNEIGELITKGQPGPKVFEMNLERVSDTEWPLGTPVEPK